MGAINFAIVIGPNILRTMAEITNPMKAIDDNKHMQTTISTMIEYYKQILPNQNDLYKFDKATNPKWKYGVIDNNASQQPQQPPKLTTSSSGGGTGNSSGGFGLFELTKNVQGVINSDAMKQFSKSTGTINTNNINSKPLIMKKNEINKIKFKETHRNKSPKNIAPQSSQSKYETVSH